MINKYFKNYKIRTIELKPINNNNKFPKSPELLKNFNKKYKKIKIFKTPKLIKQPNKKKNKLNKSIDNSFKYSGKKYFYNQLKFIRKIFIYNNIDDYIIKYKNIINN